MLCNGPCSLTAFWMGKQPGTFFYWYTVKAAALFSTRYYIYSQKHWQYYMVNAQPSHLQLEA